MCSCSIAYSWPLILLWDGTARASGFLGILIQFVMGLLDRLLNIIR